MKRRNATDATARLRQLVAEYRSVEAGLSEPRLVDSMADMSVGRDFPILAGGGPKNFGNLAPRRFLQFLFGSDAFSGTGSGRRELAERLASPANPLTARVMVNSHLPVLLVPGARIEDTMEMPVIEL